MAKLSVGIFLCEVDDERQIVTERCRENKARAVEIDHRFHRLRNRVGLWNIFLFDNLYAWHVLERLDRDGVGLVPAEIVARANIDDADRQVGGAKRASDPAEIERHPRRADGSGFQE